MGRFPKHSVLSNIIGILMETPNSLLQRSLIIGDHEDLPGITGAASAFLEWENWQAMAETGHSTQISHRCYLKGEK